MISDPITVAPDQKISEAQEIMNKYGISGLPGNQAMAGWSEFLPIGICALRRSSIGRFRRS